MSSNMIVFPEIVSALSEITNTSSGLCETFLKELFSVVTDELKGGGMVVIKGLGSFQREGQEILFEPDMDLALSLNAAFDCFEPIEVGDEEILKMMDDNLGKLPERSEEHAEINAGIEEVLPPPVPEEDKIGKESALKLDNESKENIDSREEDSEKDELNDGGDDSSNEDSNNHSEARRFWLGYVAGFISALLISGASWLFLVENSPTEKAERVLPNEITAENASLPEPADTMKEIKKQEGSPADTVVRPETKTQYFKVTSTAYLSNISRKYYGHYAFWVYIYIENKDVIKDPDNLPVGTVLRIPDAEKYGIDKNDPSSIKRAQIEALKIEQER